MNTDTLLAGDSVLADKQAPTIISPSASGGRALNQSVKLTWTTKIPARYYEIQVASDSAFLSPIAGSPFQVTAPTTELSLTLPSPIRYYWRVRTNYNSPGVYSSGYFDAMDSSVYVYCPGSFATCDDSGQAGNQSHPFRTIGAALAYARTTTVSDIIVATREAGATYSDTLIVISGVNLKGGYTSTFAAADRNVGTNKSKVTYNGTVLFALNVTSQTLIEGFNLIANGTTGSITLIAGSSNALTLQNNRIETTVTQPGPHFGLLVQNSGTTHANGPLLRDNVILSGNVNTASSTVAAVRLENSALQLRNNFIKSGTIVNGITNFLSLASGLLVVNSNPLVANNVIIANAISSGTEAWSIGVYHFSAADGIYSNNTIATIATNGNIYAFAINGGTGKPMLTNNIFYQSNGYSWLLWEWNVGDDPVSLHNNAFVGGFYAYRDMQPGPASYNRNAESDLQSASLTNQGGAASVAGNIRPAGTCIPFKNITYPNDDWQLQQNGCTANEWRDIRYGGRNTNLSNCGTGSSSCGAVTTDLNAASRTAVNTGSSPVANAAGYAMGAYEQD